MTSSKPATRRIALVVGAVLALLGVASGVYAATRGPSFEMTVKEGRTAFGAGQLGGYAVDIERLRGHDGAVTLRAKGLPKGAKSSWTLADGRALPKTRFVHERTGRWTVSKEAVTLDARHRRAYLVVGADSRTKTGFTRPVIAAKSGRLVKRDRLTMSVIPPRRFTAASRRPEDPVAAAQLPGLSPEFRLNRSLTVAAAPARQSVFQTDVTDFTVALTRSEGVGAATLSVTGLPDGATAKVDPANPVSGSTATITVETTRDTPPGEYDLTITGAADGAASSTAATLVVEQVRDFTMTGDLAGPLTLGQTQTLPVRIDNPYDFPLVISELTVDVTTGQPGCAASENFTVRQADLSEPLEVPPGESDLSDHLDDAELPTVTWENTDEPQNACLGAPLDFAYSGLAGR